MIQQTWQDAQRASAQLKKKPLEEKLKHIEALKNVVLERREEIIDRIQAETKKCRSDALMSEIFGVLDHLDYLLKFSSKILQDRKVPTSLALMGKKSQIFFEPMGKVLVISPWNYPFYQAIVPCTLSFVTGNATLYKPSEITPLEGLVEKLLQEAGFESHWVQVIYGDGAVAQELIEKRPDKIFFTGSVATGKKVMAHAAEQLIPVELELGGKDPCIVFEDVNIKRTAAGVLWGALTNCGQSCTSVERIYVQESIIEKFSQALLQQAKHIKQEQDSNGDSDVGEMTSEAQIKIVAEHLQDALDKGAKLLNGESWDGQSSKIPPLILTGVKEEMSIAREETFGPVLPIFSFQDEAQAVEKANHSSFGLSASVWSKDKIRAVRIARALEVGNVSVNNVMLTEGNHALPFGGVKDSGIGRYKGEFGFYSFSNIKSVLIDADSSKIEANWYPYTAKKYQLFSQMTLAFFGRGVVNFLRFLLAGLSLESYSQKAKRG